MELGKVPQDSQEMNLERPQEKVGGGNLCEKMERVREERIQILVRLFIGHGGGCKLNEVCPLPEPCQILAELPKGLENGKLIDLVQRRKGPLEVDKSPVREDLEAPPESAPDPAGPRGHRPDLSPVPGVEDDDPIGLPEIVTPHDNRLCAAESHADHTPR